MSGGKCFPLSTTVITPIVNVREQLEVDPVEVSPCFPLGASQPQPVYKDENITLYGIPVTPQLPAISIRYLTVILFDSQRIS